MKKADIYSLICIFMCTLAILVCCKSILPPYQSVLRRDKVIGDWNNNSCYYVSNHECYSIKRYDIFSDKHYLITKINADTAIVSLTVSNNDSLIYLVKQPVSYKEFVGYIPDGGGGPAEVKAFRKIVHTIHSGSIFSIYDIANRCYQYETTFTAPIENILLHPSNKCVIINTVVYSERQTEKISDTMFFQIVDFSVYSFNLMDSRFSMLFEHAFALGYLPDSSLLLYKRDGNEWILTAIKDSQATLFSANLSLGKLLPKVRMVPFTNYLSWYERATNTVVFYNLITNNFTSVPAQSRSYCISPDASKILFFIIEHEPDKLKCVLVPI